MELIRKNIHMHGVKAKAVTQLTLDEDINVPDTNEDIGRMIQEKACFHIDEVKGEDNQALIKGSVQLDLLYSDAVGEGRLQVMNTRIPVEQVIHMDGVSPLDNINVRGDLEDVSLSLINSRKINLKGIISLSASADELRDEEVIVEIMDEKKAVQTMGRELSLLQMRMHKKDNCRMKDEIVLSSAKPNIYQMLWYQIQPCNVEIKKLDGQLSIHGELKIFILYSSEEENHPIQIVEEILPFHNTVDCTGCSEDLVSQIQWEMNQFHVEVRPDYDGEERVFGIEGIMELEIRLFGEENVQILADVYSTAQEAVPVMADITYQTLLVKNQSKSRVNGNLSIGKNQPRILQIYQAMGEVRADEIQETDEGLMVEGVVCVQLLYVTSDDEMPYASMKGQIPFQQLVEVPDMEEEADYMIQADMEQLQAIMSDSEEVEFKGMINLNVLVLGHRQTSVIKELDVREMDYARLNDIPGMTGYIAEEGDTLWKIAKEYSTTVDLLRQMNDFKGEEVRRGDKFLILKTVSG
ncbi:MAG: DUF3794 domain-containing protein [Lachnospiraceae bacterium]|nr:DUF3794 domain-containing protein [Lachnospiraceae bacterium]